MATKKKAEPVIEYPRINTMDGWVACGGHHEDQPMRASAVAKGLTTMELLSAHSRITVRLSGPLADKERELWDQARDAVCAVLGQRIDAALSHGHGDENQ